MPARNSQPRKRWGQHFLNDIIVIEKIIAAVQPCPEDTIVEIGPGKGALTAPLLQKATVIDAIEIDRDLSAQLRDQFGRGLNLHTADVLDFDFNQIHPGKNLTIVGNLPYNVSTPILFHLINFIDRISNMYLMLQLEVAARLVALAGTKKYSRISVILACFAKTKLLFEIDPEVFTPRPEVTSAFIHIVPQPQPLLADSNQRKKLEHIVQRAFTHRRKILAKAYRGMFDIEQLMSLGIDPTARPETLTPENFIDMLKYTNYGR